jgi:hypothetical protein
MAVSVRFCDCPRDVLTSSRSLQQFADSCVGLVAELPGFVRVTEHRFLNINGREGFLIVHEHTFASSGSASQSDVDDASFIGSEVTMSNPFIRFNDGESCVGHSTHTLRHSFVLCTDKEAFIFQVIAHPYVGPIACSTLLNTVRALDFVPIG